MKIGFRFLSFSGFKKCNHIYPVSSPGSLTLNFLLTPVHVSEGPQGAQHLLLSSCAAVIGPMSPPWRGSRCLGLALHWGFTFPMENQALSGNTVGWIAGSKWQSRQGEGKEIFH